MKIKSVLTGFDLIISVIISLLIYIFINKNFITTISNEIANTGITVFAVIFPLFFAAFTIIITSSDDEFAKYLHNKNFYVQIIGTFKFTLWLNFISLILSIFLYFYTLSFSNNNQILGLNFYYFAVLGYIFICIYSLLATFNSILDSIKYAKYRALYFTNKK